jgi:hypothetical protein
MIPRGLAAPLRRTSRRITVLYALLLAMPATVIGQFDPGPPDGPMPPPPPEVVDHVTAVILDALDGHPLDGVAIAIADRPRPATPASATSDAFGKFVFDVHHPAPRSPLARPESASVYLTLSKPGYLPLQQSVLISFTPNPSELRLKLMPEGVLHGTLNAPEVSELAGVLVSLMHHQVQDGLGVWLGAGTARADSHGEFQFRELPAGDYKIMTQMFGVRGDGPPSARTITGYPPIFSGNAHNLASAAVIHVSAGRTSEAALTLSRTPFYNVTIPLANLGQKTGLGIVVGTEENPSGAWLGLSSQTRMINGFLPDGTYDVHIATVGVSPSTVYGSISVKVAGAPIQTEPISLTRNQDIIVDIHEDFTVPMEGVQPERWQFRPLNLWIVPVGSTQQRRSLGNAMGPDAKNLQLANVEEGTYRVSAQAIIGYVASIRSNGVDLARKPLVAGPGGASSPIDVTLRNDNTITLSGTVFPWDAALDNRDPTELHAILTCIPLENFALPVRTTWPNNGKFSLPNLAPGKYLVLASRTPLSNLEYRNGDVLRQYQPKGIVVTVDASQQAQIQVPMMESVTER